MAIQFHCPYCTASIRVADAAAGKQGTCPKCGTKLIVPKVGPAADSTGAAKSESHPAERSDSTDFNPSPIAEESAAPEFSLKDSAVTEEPSMARVVRRRSRRKGVHPLIPIALFGVILACLLYWMWKPKASLEGELTAVRLEDFTIPPARIDRSTLGLSADEADQTMAEMAEHPPSRVLVRDWFDMRFDPEPEGLNVEIRPTSATEVFRVKLRPSVRRFLTQQGKDLLARKESEFQTAAKNFLKDWRAFREKDLPLKMESYRESLGFNSLTGTAGFCLVAQIGARKYRAVHEEGDDLYFLLPIRTKKFVIKGREFSDGEMIFPGRLTVKVKNPRTPSTPPDSSEAPPSDSSDSSQSEPAENSSEKTPDASRSKT